MNQQPEIVAEHGFGLNNMRDRAKGLGGCLMIESQPGAGTAIVVRIPKVAAQARR